MDSPDARRLEINAFAGMFLAASGVGIYLLLDDRTYATACIALGVLFVAKSIADLRAFGAD